MLGVVHLEHRFRAPGRGEGFAALSDVSLEVAPGEVHCLLGASGSGKSTLLRLIAGLEDVQQGSITIDGALVADGGRHSVPPERRPVGFVFQDYALFPHLSVRRNLAFGMRELPAAEREDRVAELLRQVDLEGHADAMPHTLSGGQQQRVALARALARRPRLMLLDEPFSGLDTQLRAAIRQTTVEVLRSEGMASLIVTHDPQEALLLGDRVSVLDGGRLLQTDTAERLYRHPASLAVAEVFGPVNRLVAEVVTDGTRRVDLGWATVSTDFVRGLEPTSRSVELVVRAEELIALPCAAHGDQNENAIGTESIGTGSIGMQSVGRVSWVEPRVGGALVGIEFGDAADRGQSPRQVIGLLAPGERIRVGDPVQCEVRGASVL